MPVRSPPLNRIFQALADPTRRAILERLSRGDASVSDIAAPFDMSLAAVVQHVQVLEESGLIRTQKIGRVRTCRIDQKALGSAERWITQRRAVWERYSERVAGVMAQPKAGAQRRRKA